MRHYTKKAPAFARVLSNAQADDANKHFGSPAVKIHKKFGNFLSGLILTIFVVILHSCQFDTDAENFMELQKPEEQIDIMINLYGLNPEEIIYAPLNSFLAFQIDADGRELLNMQFFLDGEQLYNHGINEGVLLQKQTYDNLIHDLTVVVAFKTHTGSLAEHLGLEAYLGAHEFKIKFLPESSQLNLRYRSNEDGYLVLEWDKPKDYEVWGYDVIEGNTDGTGKTIQRIEDPHKTSHTINNYAYGTQNYAVAAYIKNSQDLLKSEEIYIKSQRITRDHIITMRTGINKLHVKWENPNTYPAQYVIEYGENEVFYVKDNHEGVTVNTKLFPMQYTQTTGNRFDLYVLPEEADPADYKEIGYYKNSYEILFVNDFSINSRAHAYNSNENMLHHLTDKTVDSYEVPSMKLISSENHNMNLLYSHRLKINSQGIVALTDPIKSDDIINIYDNYTLSNKINSFSQHTYHHLLTDNNQLLIKHGYLPMIEIYDILSGEKLLTHTWQASYEDGSINIECYIAPDGKRLIVKCRDTHTHFEPKLYSELFSIENNALQLLQTHYSNDRTGHAFHPHNETIINRHNDNSSNNKKITITNRLDEIIKTFDGQLIGVDPVTGNFAYYKFSSTHPDASGEIIILNPDYSQQLLKLPVSAPISSGTLVNNLIIFNNIYLNLEQLEEWNQ